MTKERIIEIRNLESKTNSQRSFDELTIINREYSELLEEYTEKIKSNRMLQMEILEKLHASELEEDQEKYEKILKNGIVPKSLKDSLPREKVIVSKEDKEINAFMLAFNISDRSKAIKKMQLLKEEE